MPKGIFQSDQPLWLPKGSIRAVIALVVVVTWVVLLARGLAVSKEFYVVLGAIVTFYFMARENDRDRELEAGVSRDLKEAVQSVFAGERSSGKSAD